MQAEEQARIAVVRASGEHLAAEEGQGADDSQAAIVEGDHEPRRARGDRHGPDERPRHP